MSHQSALAQAAGGWKALGQQLSATKLGGWYRSWQQKMATATTVAVPQRIPKACQWEKLEGFWRMYSGSTWTSETRRCFIPISWWPFLRSPQPPFLMGWFLFLITYLRDSNGLSSSKSKPITEAPEPNTDGTQSLPPQVPRDVMGKGQCQGVPPGNKAYNRALLKRSIGGGG